MGTTILQSLYKLENVSGSSRTKIYNYSHLHQMWKLNLISFVPHPIIGVADDSFEIEFKREKTA